MTLLKGSGYKIIVSLKFLSKILNFKRLTVINTKLIAILNNDGFYVIFKNTKTI